MAIRVGQAAFVEVLVDIHTAYLGGRSYPGVGHPSTGKSGDALAKNLEIFLFIKMMNSHSLARLYQAAHNVMRDIDGLQPQESLDELLKYIFFRERDEASSAPLPHDEATEGAMVSSAAAAIRERFSNYIQSSEAIPARWSLEELLLSDLALTKVHHCFSGANLNGADFDLRSAALREFLTGPIRKGLGIFLTPDEVVREIVAAVSPASGDKILDPACGSGTFLMEAAKFLAQSGPLDDVTVYGVDKNPRMLQLAEFNCGHLSRSRFFRAAADSLLPFSSPDQPGWYQSAQFDVVLTNPPFGVTLDARAYPFEQYATCLDAKGQPQNRQGSEIVFLERALQLLKPGGQLGIVLPRSVVTNKRMAAARARLGELGGIKAIITLPPETFAATGTQTTTVVLIVERYGSGLKPEDIICPVIARIDNVGFDLTGRSRAGNQLPNLGHSLRAAMDGETPSSNVQLLDPISAQNSFGELENLLGEQRDRSIVRGRRMSDVIAFAGTGATPPRAAYAPSGLFLIKVGNLTGSGINWAARDRNFVGGPAVRKYSKPERKLVSGDILLTSSAHVSKYIAKKVDIITHVPQEVGGEASFVGEVMLVRATPQIDPFRLLAYLRSPSVAEALQDRVRGQTAHLHPSDLLDLWLNDELFGSSNITEIAAILRREAEINDELNALAFRQIELRASFGEQAALVEVAAE